MIRSLAGRLAVGLSLALAAASPAALAAGAGLALKHDVTVRNDVVTLGDLIDGAGPAGATPAFRAPALGATGTIQVPRIVEAAREAGLSVDPGLAAQVVVTRAARRISKGEVEGAVRAALAQRYGLSEADLNATLEGGDEPVFVEPEATAELKVNDIAYEPRTQRVQATLAVPGSRALALKPIRLAGQVIDTIEVPVLTRPIARGESVRSTDVRLDRRPRAEAGTAGALVDVAALQGRVARGALQAGAVLREVDLAKQEIVEKNSMVSVTYKTPGLELSIRAKALESGGLGDVVLVQNPQSKRQLQGTVSGPGKVTVIGAMPGPVASAQ